MSSYALGVDLGTTYSAAAIARGSQAQPLSLGVDAAQIPSVVLIREDGEVLIGDAAERRASAEPTRSAREFKRRLGDPVPMVIGDKPFAVEALMGHLLREIVRKATEQEGEAPAKVVLTHPANYTEYKVNLLREAARLAGVDTERLVLLTEPEAAAVAYSRDQRVEAGEIVAVYDFGGGTFDAALVRRSANGFELIGVPEGMERLGGIDFDQAVMAHVDSTLGGLVSGADRNDPQTRPAQARLRSECRRAKEALSTDSDTTIPVSLPGLQTEVRLTRDEFETMIRPRIVETVRALERAVASAHIEMDQISRVLLVGGSSRMPIVAELVRSATGRQVSLDAHPKLAIAVGASLFGAAAVAPNEPLPVADEAWQAPIRQAPIDKPSTPAPKPRNGRRVGLFVAVGAAVGVAAVAVLSMGGDSKDDSTPATTTLGGTTGTTDGATSDGRGVSAVVNKVADVSGITAVAVGADGSVYVATDDLTVSLVAGGAITVVASLDPAEGAPGGLAIAADGSVLASTSAGIRSFADGGSTLLLDSAANGLGATPGPIALDGVGNLYIADNATHRIIRRSTDGSLSLIAGTGAAATSSTVSGDGQAAGTVAIGTITGLAIDSFGNLLFADATTLALRAVSFDGTLSTIAGGGAIPIGGPQAWVADGTSGRDLAFGSVDGLAVDFAARAYVTDSASGAIVRIGTDGLIDLIITRTGGDATNGVPASDSSIGEIGAAAMDRNGTLFFKDGGSLRGIEGV